MASKRNAPPRIPADAKLVACLDGPLVNQWFYLDEWHERRATEERMHHTPETGAALGYVPVRGETVQHPHPELPHITAHALAYAPDVATMASKQAS
jgi:hypothetical protein